MKITVEMEPRELHEMLMLAAATMAPDDPEPQPPQQQQPPQPPIKVQSKRMPAKPSGGYGYTENLPAPTKDIRQWAKDAGMHPAKGGMLPQDIIEAYRQAHRGARSA
jgi:hypothetical protein